MITRISPQIVNSHNVSWLVHSSEGVKRALGHREFCSFSHHGRHAEKFVPRS